MAFKTELNRYYFVAVIRDFVAVRASADEKFCTSLADGSFRF